MVPDESERCAERFFDASRDALEVALFERLTPRLRQQDRTVAVDGEPRRALRDSVKQSIAVGPLPRHPFEERFPPLESGYEEVAFKRQGRSAGGGPPWSVRAREIS